MRTALAVMAVLVAGCEATVAEVDGGSAGGSAGGAGIAGGGTAGGASGGTAGGASGGSTAGGASGGSSAGGSAGGATAGGSAGGVVAGGGSPGPVDGGTPAWRQGLAAWQWVELPGSALSNQRVADPFNGTMVAPTQRINAWNGLAVNRDNNRVYLAGAGGHADWAGNEAYEIDLQADQPRWRLLRGPTPGTAISIEVEYYADGRPSSTHLYYALQYVRSHGRIFRLSAGSNWGSGNFSSSNVDAFSLASNDWDPAGTWQGGMPAGGNIGRPYAQHEATDDAFTFFGGSFRKWTASTAMWSTLAARPSYAGNDVVSESPSAVDTTRQRVLFTRNAYRVMQLQGLVVTFSGTSMASDVTFTGPGAASAIQQQAGLEYLARDDAYFLKTSTGGAVTRINASTFEATVQPTTGPTPPDAVNGVYNRWRYLPLLRGFMYLPSGSSNFWFLAAAP